ncbi:MAG: UDP-glucose 4-epimerase [Candidatus Amesbacteria bacterium GW2011_GWB1_47_19]|nr:MAG: UDP-glucose 4-epimerase [Candidatus Amesbacteria bacterium GW2011_GWA1_44_24]KKU31691.1 MAG: UDP-glucose 4-epimerase [Candidatus Amesbacteria bacterium GW2011_GWC1_46_24]KKU67604.1 MAG: UDP-glucose 4-epimerase [Candidatus Amesbacteria bacterium GW2011_GWB1_47_19]HBC72858.1 hypothetical protein [Candidatus Amesbacteria bacterium]
MSMTKNPCENIIIGGNGFIGTYITELLTKSGNSSRIIDSHAHADSQAEQVAITIGPECNDQELKSAIAGKRIFILVGQIKPDFNEDYELAALKKLFSCVDFKMTRQIIYTSSALIYGDTKKPAVETDPINPVDSYSRFKSKSEDLCKMYFNQKTGINLLITRLSNVYGGVKNRGFIGLIINKSKNEIKPTIDINGDGKQTRDYIHVIDVANAILSIAGNEVNDIVNVSFGISWSLLEIIDKFNNLSPNNIHTNIKGNLLNEVKQSRISNQKLRDIYGYTPAISLDRGLELSLL